MRSRLSIFAKQFGLKMPAIIQAPMAGGITTPQLVAAVSNANGLGSFAAGYLTTEQVESGIREIKKLTKNSFAVNVFIPNVPKQNAEEVRAYQRALNKFRHDLGLQKENDVPASLVPPDNFREIIDVLLHESVRVVSFTFGNLPADVIRALQANGTYLIGTATSLEEAKILADSNIDAIVAQGSEAGGHRGGFITPCKDSSVGLMALLPRITGCIDRPIIAAGGIMDGQSIVAAMALGAASVQMGTAFLATTESGANPCYKSELIKVRGSDVDVTTLTAAYSGKMARAISTEFVEYMREHVVDFPAYPISNTLSSPVRKEAEKQEAINIISMWCGQGVPLIRENLSASELMEQLRVEVKQCLSELSKSQP